jgi:hypothetical protein
MGLKKAAVARLCINPDIYRSMPDICSTYLPSVAPVAVVAPAAYETPYAGGEIWLVEGATGRDRLCMNYDATRQRCRVWAGAVNHPARKKQGDNNGKAALLEGKS